MTIEQAAQNIFNLMRRDFDVELKTRLSNVPGLDIVRAKDELVFLDLFSVYFSIKCNTIPEWHERGELVYEIINSLFVNWVGNVWSEKGAGSHEDVVNIINARFRSYLSCIENIIPTDYNKLKRSIGEIFAIYAFADSTFMGPDGKALESRFMELQNKIKRDVEEVTINVGIEVFWHRVVVMLDIFKKYKIKE